MSTACAANTGVADAMRAFRQHVPAGKMARHSRRTCGATCHRVCAKDVQRHAFRDRWPSYRAKRSTDHGGAHELRVCYSAQPPERAVEAARAIAKGIAEAERH
jgi:hypothetical protein